MPQYDVTSPDGKTYSVTAPDGATQDDAIKYVQSNFYKPTAADTINNDAISQGARAFAGQGSDALGGVSQAVLNTLGGFVRGAGSIGATLARPFESGAENDARRAGIDANMQAVGAQPDSLFYKGGKLGGEVAGTAGAGGVLANGLRATGAAGPAVDALATSLQTGGFRTGGQLGTLANALTRVAGGAAVGGASAGMVNPADAGTGAVIGGSLPLAAQVVGKAGEAIGSALVGDGVSPEVAALAQKAKDLGINIPADRLVNSRPMNAVAASLNYVPLSGRAATEDAMNSQLNKALSNTFGQDSSNVTMALRQASDQLGAKFETTLKNNPVTFDAQLLNDVADVGSKAQRTLGTEALRPIEAQITELFNKGASGQIDGQAAYNIKRELDTIANGSGTEAHAAIDLKKALLGALNRSLGPDEAAKFATVRQQYGNMLDLEKLATNGVDGGVSVARLANMKNINNQPLQDIANIAAQFVKPREGAHGAAQRVFGAGGAGVAAGLAALGLPGALPAAIGAGTVMAGGRVANGLLNSDAARNFLLNQNLLQPQPLGLLTQGAYRVAPLLLTGD